ncbi:histidinol-phosphate transaminase [Psychromonas sp. psych-6C06]|uniref:histidinol-phosphate transaminase n=1 Tax=Psychromonas sp. psych-6C06 TaxID=2058089 RepID=UPI000C337E77|nr:histidinol-phosphate transaminase [Psychromonas sp. psych-6C06]PKF62267.1 histidinol-phosphate transaminase [Psychromonas sp. psych-6C06]
MSCDFLSLANSGVQKLHPYQAGKPTDELERELGITDIVKLASNENPLGLAPSVKGALQNELTELTRYPDANGYYLKKALADKYAIEIEQVTLGNGSNDLLELIARAFVSRDDEVMYAEHAFVVYPLVTQAIGAKAVVVPAKDYGHDLVAMANAITAQTKLIFIANPNNPTGTFLEQEAIHAFLSKVPSDVLVVLDEAYFEYATASRRGNAIEWINEFPNLIVSRTFSKAYGLAGLRVGYAISHPDIADILNRVRQPFNCNALALKAAETVLNDEEYLQKSVALNNQGMDDLSAFFTDNNLDFIASMGNFITVDVGKSGDEVYQALLQQGVIVRPITGYGLANHLRISIGTQAENQRFKEALTTVLNLES